MEGSSLSPFNEATSAEHFICACIVLVLYCSSVNYCSPEHIVHSTTTAGPLGHGWDAKGSQPLAW
eukprot:scaffold8179_cov430-Prasinococcus_capsulatus_cf.AAC.15